MAPTAKAADKKKSKKTSRSGAETTSRSKEKGDRKSKDKDRKASSKKEKATTPAEPVAATTPTPTPAPPLVHDPDAIQLFRRYDRNRSGVLTRLDFLQLLRDYGDPGSSGWGATLSRPPLSLTDTSGIPLGYQRADRNSEFEAGQLFERYDKDHSGALTLDTFHVFFADFKLQLRAFVEESNYRALAPPAPAVSVTPAPLHPVKEEDEPVPTPVTASVRDTASSSDDVAPSPKALRAKYRATLWRLRKICKDELFDQRENIVQRMKLIRDGMATRQRHTNRSSGDTRWGDSRRGKQRPITVSFPDFDDGKTIIADEDGAIAEKGEAQQYESMEDDLDKLDELIRYVRRYLNKGECLVRTCGDRHAG
ncbi:unnamed protein product [Phytophthora lilii]|uniref:Unnamed protein product n=1 Tax=Phytophthora lilii TaxID=2077276 RepID=A0A9W6TLZ5_9STRA|nr:unnamed protein product [Phytophthora lilii]